MSMMNPDESSTQSTAEGAPRRPSGRRWIGAVLLGCLVVGVVLAVRYGWQATPVDAEVGRSGVRPLPVNVLAIEYVDHVTLSRSYTGTVRAKNRSDLGFEMTGKIAEVMVEEGDSVSAGAPLAHLDVDRLLAQENAMRASIGQAESRLAEMESGPRTETIRAAQSACDAAESQFRLAQSSLARRRSLYDQHAISKEEFDTARFGEQTAAANLKTAQQRLAEIEAGTRQEQLDAQHAVLDQLQASLEEIEVTIAKGTLLSPFAGTVTERYLDPGSIAPASTPVVRVVAEQELECWIGLPVGIVAELTVGDHQEVSVGDAVYSATVLAKIRELDMRTRTQTVLLELAPAASHAVVSGQLCELKINSQTEAAGFWVPHSALVKGVRGLWSVFALVRPAEAQINGQNKGRSGSGIWNVEKRDIEILRTESDRVLARGTLEMGDKIVVDGVHRIAVGQRVEPVVSSPLPE